MDIKSELGRFEEIKSRVAQRTEAAQSAKFSLEHNKKLLKERMDALKEKGLSFTNVTELKAELDVRVNRLSEVLDATERKLNS